MDDQLIATQLRMLDDIVEPPLISYLPQTWGWAVLGCLLLLIVLLVAWRQYRRWRANWYRRAALTEIDDLERQLRLRSADFSIVAALLKRTALAAWSRPTVAALSGDAWTKFLADHAAGNQLDESLAAFLRESQYRAAGDGVVDPAELFKGAREWIEGHHV